METDKIHNNGPSEQRVEKSCYCRQCTHDEHNGHTANPDVDPYGLIAGIEHIKSICDGTFPDDPSAAVSMLQTAFVSYVIDIYGPSDEILDRLMDAVYSSADELRRSGYGQ